MILIYLTVLIILSVYSFTLIDPNITLTQAKWWVNFRDPLVYLGYYRRDLSWIIYLISVMALFGLNRYFLKNVKKYNPVKLAILTGLVLLLANPFLSHDFYNYMFDTKIVTYYHQNPYFHKALDFQQDKWLRFMQWTHRTYPYGPIFLLITLIPSLLSMGKFALDFIFFKSTFVFFYIIAVFYLAKIDRKASVYLATNPLIIVEGLISSHNDLIALSLGIIGIYYLTHRQDLKARIILLFSSGIKFLTIPAVFLIKENKFWTKLIFVISCGLILYLSVKSEIQPWYFLNLFIFLPFYERLINRLDIFFFGLLISYYPYIRLGGWDTQVKVGLKHEIIFFFGLLNALYLIFTYKIIPKQKKVKT